MKNFSCYILLVGIILGMMAVSLPSLVFAGQSPTTEAFTFVQVCDPQLGMGGYQQDVIRFKQAVRRINALKPDFVVICGDLVHNFNDNSVADFNEIKSGLTVPCYPAPGNHDVGSSPTVSRLNSYREAIGDDYFSFEHNGYTFVIANTSLWKVTVQGESETHDSWFRQKLEAARDKNSPVFVVQHHPVSDLPLAKRNELLALFEASGVVALLAGHTHRTTFNEHKGIQLVIGETTSDNFDGRPFGFRLWHVDSPESTRHEFIALEPSVDFNRDEKVDLDDLCRLAQYWLQDNASADISPGPYGDEIVDFMDLAVFAKYWLKDFRMLAYWRLDETEGTIAHDRAGGHSGALHGDPTWQPEGGQVDGALEFDGIDDYVSTAFVLDPGDDLFSVFAWVKGGAPGQVIISQTKGGASWLCTDPIEGNLMTELKGIGRGGTALLSQTVITDDSWHHIGFVWDGSYRYLYVDGVEVSKDSQGLSGFLPTDGGLYIGAGKTLEAGSFFSGLIDDIRIYDRAVIP